MTRGSRLLLDHIISRREPSAAALVATLAGAGAGNVDDGLHRYCVTFVTAEGETNSGLTAAVVVANKAVDGQVSLTAIPTGSSYVTARKIYRTEAGLGVLKLLTTLSDNFTTTYTDNTADAGLGAVAPDINTTDNPIESFYGELLGLGIGVPLEPFHFAWNSRFDKRVNYNKSVDGLTAANDYRIFDVSNAFDSRGVVDIRSVYTGTLTAGTTIRIQHLDVVTIKHNNPTGTAGTVGIMCDGAADLTVAANTITDFYYNGSLFYVSIFYAP